MGEKEINFRGRVRLIVKNVATVKNIVTLRDTKSPYIFAITIPLKKKSLMFLNVLDTQLTL